MSDYRRILKSTAASLFALIITSAAAAFAQVVTADITGRVADPSGAAVVGATVTARNTGTGLSRTTQTNDEGSFTITQLSPGTYEITAEAANFSRARLPNIENWSTEDVQMVSRLFVRNMVSNAEEVVEMPDGRPDLEEQIKEGARRQMRLIVVGFRDWRS